MADRNPQVGDWVELTAFREYDVPSPRMLVTYSDVGTDGRGTVCCEWFTESMEHQIQHFLPSRLAVIRRTAL